MSYGVYLSASGAQAQQHRLTQLSHNLANSQTPGYKPKQTVLQARFAELIDSGTVSPGGGGIDELGGGVTIRPEQTEYRAGPVRETGNATDFAIGGPDDFFVLRRGDQQLLTRAGDFLFDNTGTMVNAGGDAVLGSDGQPIRIDPRLPYDVAAGGRIQQGGGSQELMLARPEKGDLSHVGGNLFKPIGPMPTAPPGSRIVQSGALEQSAVRPTEAMMELIETSRAYEANVQLMKHHDSLSGGLISRVLS